jgi:hypothetical protein
MKRMRVVGLAIGLLAVASITQLAVAQDGPEGQGGPGGLRRGANMGRPGPMGGGIHLLPPFIAERLELTSEQKKQIEELEKETKAKLEKILTAKQKKMLEQVRPMRPGQGGPGGPGGQGGPGRGRGPGGGPGGRPGGGPGGPGGPGGGPPPERPDSSEF